MSPEDARRIVAARCEVMNLREYVGGGLRRLLMGCDLSATTRLYTEQHIADVERSAVRLLAALEAPYVQARQVLGLGEEAA